MTISTTDKRTGGAAYRSGFRSGQAMILTTLVLSSTVLALAAIGGYLTIIRIRMSSNIVDTTRAIYAADAGIECEAFNRMNSIGIPQGSINCNGGPYSQFSYNGGVDPKATFTATFNPAPTQFIRADGVYNQTSRSFRLDF